MNADIYQDHQRWLQSLPDAEREDWLRRSTWRMKMIGLFIKDLREMEKRTTAYLGGVTEDTEIYDTSTYHTEIVIR